MATTLEIGTMISRIMNLDFSQQQKMLYHFLKKGHFVPSVQRDDFASGVDNFVIWLSYKWFYSFVNVLCSF